MTKIKRLLSKKMRTPKKSGRFSYVVLKYDTNDYKRISPKVGESFPLYETHSCLHENDGARLDRSLMTILRYGDIGRRGERRRWKRFVLSLQTRSDRVALGPGFYRLVRKFFTACKLHTIFGSDRETYFPTRIHISYIAHELICHSSDYLLFILRLRS